MYCNSFNIFIGAPYFPFSFKHSHRVFFSWRRRRVQHSSVNLLSLLLFRPALTAEPLEFSCMDIIWLIRHTHPEIRLWFGQLSNYHHVSSASWSTVKSEEHSWQYPSVRKRASSYKLSRSLKMVRGLIRLLLSSLRTRPGKVHFIFPFSNTWHWPSITDSQLHRWFAGLEGQGKSW